MLHYYPEMVRPGYRQLPEAPSSQFFKAITTGDPTMNPTGTGGLPFDKASAAIGKKIADYRSQRFSEAIKLRLSDRQQTHK